MARKVLVLCVGGILVLTLSGFVGLGWLALAPSLFPSAAEAEDTADNEDTANPIWEEEIFPGGLPPQLSPGCKMSWVLPNAAQARKRAGTPPSPDFEKSFVALLQSTLQPQWLPDDWASQWRYLRGWQGYPSLFESTFYLYYRKATCDFVISGPIAELVILIKLDQPVLPPVVTAELEQARVRTAGNVLDVYRPERKPGTSAEEVSRYLRDLAVLYLQSEIVTRGVQSFPRAWLNGGLYTVWSASVFHDPIQSDQPVSRTVGVWTNGRIVRFHIGLERLDFHPLYVALLPEPLEAEASPLNPEAVRYFDLLYPTTPEGWAISEQEATHCWVHIDLRLEKVQGEWEQVWVPLPLTEARWHLAEWAVLTHAALQMARLHACDQGRIRYWEEVERHARAYHDFWNEFQRLQHPVEVEKEHQPILAALADNERIWQIVEEVWQSDSKSQRSHPRDDLATDAIRSLGEEGLTDMPNWGRLRQVFEEQLHTKFGMRLNNHIGPLQKGFGEGT